MPLHTHASSGLGSRAEFITTIVSSPDKRGGFYRSMQHHLKDLLFKDGVYDPEETIEAFSHARN
jgi:hypothetical protein